MSKSTCSVPDCDKPSWARGWCNNHYQLWRRNGEPVATRFAKRPCSIAGCDNAAVKRTWCGTHYRRWQRQGSTDPKRPIRHSEYPVIDGRKQCTSCGDWKPVHEFPRRNICCACRRELQAAWKAANPDYWREWQAANSDKVSAAVQKRRAQRLSRDNEFIDRSVVFERDGFTCRLCGDPLAMSEKCPHPLAPTVDHIVPLNRGGHHLYTNVQSAHFHCNTSKGDRDAPRSRPSVA